MKDTNEPVDMPRAIDLPSTSYGDRSTLTLGVNGGALLFTPKRWGESRFDTDAGEDMECVRLDPGQMRILRAALAMDPKEASRVVAKAIVEHWETEGGDHPILLLVIIGMVGFMSGMLASLLI